MAKKDTTFKVPEDLRTKTGAYETIVVSPIGNPDFIPSPKSFDQIKMVTDSLTSPTARRLYIYSFELKDWLYINLST